MTLFEMSVVKFQTENLYDELPEMPSDCLRIAGIEHAAIIKKRNAYGSKRGFPLRKSTPRRDMLRKMKSSCHVVFDGNIVKQCCGMYEETTEREKGMNYAQLRVNKEKQK